VVDDARALYRGNRPLLRYQTARPSNLSLKELILRFPGSARLYMQNFDLKHSWTIKFYCFLNGNICTVIPSILYFGNPILYERVMVDCVPLPPATRTIVPDPPLLTLIEVPTFLI
jgi:hypothetical protein